jgi:uncharacterized protein (TIGR03435 family)
MRIVAAVGFGAIFAAISAQAQAPPAPQPHFEVASIKPNKSGDPHGTISAQAGGRYVAVNVTLLQLAAQAYGLQSSQLAGGPEWTRTDRFDVVAKADRDIQSADASVVSFSPLQLMLQALLADRFKLGVRTESREMSIYALVLARADRTLGPNMRPSSTDCTAQLTARGRAGGPPPGPPSFNEPLTCGLRMGHGRLSAIDATVAQLLPSLSNTVQRVVQDRTGLTGRYYMEMSWTPDRLPQAPASGSAPSTLPPVDPHGSSIFTALQEQLGLKLESARAPVDVLVIDRVDRPTPD